MEPERDPDPYRCWPPSSLRAQNVCFVHLHRLGLLSADERDHLLHDHLLGKGEARTFREYMVHGVLPRKSVMQRELIIHFCEYYALYVPYA
jgi:hypothetical protein